MKYQEWLIKWLENYIQHSVKRRTFVLYSKIVHRHLISEIGNIDITEITPFLLQRFITKLLNSGNLKTGKGLSHNSVNAIITVVQNSLRTAYMLGYINNYPADKIKRPKPEEKKVECFSFTEQKKIEQYILSKEKSKLYGILLYLYSGLRIGELLALEWNDIDFVKGELTVSKNCHDGKNKNGVFARITDTPKTQSSIRTIPLPKQLMPILRKMKNKSESIYVVSNGRNPIFIRSYQRSFELILKKLDIEHKGFRSLRHTFATRALECGMDVKTLSEILGHKPPTVTRNRYVHSLMEHKKDMMNRLGKFL